MFSRKKGITLGGDRIWDRKYGKFYFVKIVSSNGKWVHVGSKRKAWIRRECKRLLGRHVRITYGSVAPRGRTFNYVADFVA